MPWQPGKRKARRALDGPYEDIPSHLYPAILGWIDDCLGTAPNQNDELLTLISVELQEPIPPSAPGEDDDAPAISFANYLQTKSSIDSDFALDLIEIILGQDPLDYRIERLCRLLNAANSAYTLNSARSGLEMRVPPGIKELASEVVEEAPGSAGEHLRNAWEEAYGKSSDPVKAYSEAIKAAEAALAPRISPQNSKQTLGTMIDDVEKKPTKWNFALKTPGGNEVRAVLSIMKLLWYGQTSRHGGIGETRNETPEEARAAVHLAAALVHFGVSGALEPTPPATSTTAL